MKAHSTFAVLFGLLTLGAGCASRSDSTAEDDGRLFADFLDLYEPDAKIPVCWINPEAGSDEFRELTRTGARLWEEVINIEFVGWDKCGAQDYQHLRILIADENPRSYVGTSALYRDVGMWLDATFKIWEPSCTVAECARPIATHEFGHALGLNHEQARPDTPGWCIKRDQGEEQSTAVKYGVPLGGWDIDSVMNYCNPVWGPLRLSPGDVHGIQHLYGQHGAPSFKDPVVTAGDDLGLRLVPAKRLLDTREIGARLPADQPYVLHTKDLVPPTAKAVLINVVAADPSEPGYLTAYPCNAHRPIASNVNYGAGGATSNLAAVALGDGDLCIYSLRPSDVVVDMQGYFAPNDGGSFVPETPTRLFDSRTALARQLTQGEIVPIAVPASMGATVNLTAANPSADGFLVAFPCGEPTPATSNLNFREGKDSAGLAVVRPGADDKICVFTSVATDVIVDVTGKFVANGGARFTSVVPTRLMDTRYARSLFPNRVEVLDVTHLGAVTGLTFNLTATNSDAPGYVTAYPCDQERSDTSNINFATGQNVANLVTLGASENGICFVSNTVVDIVVDLAGYTK